MASGSVVMRPRALAVSARIIRFAKGNFEDLQQRRDQPFWAFYYVGVVGLVFLSGL